MLKILGVTTGVKNKKRSNNLFKHYIGTDEKESFSWDKGKVNLAKQT